MVRTIPLLLFGAGFVILPVLASDILLFTSPNCRQSFASLMNSIESTGCIDSGDNLTAAQSVSAAGDPDLGPTCEFTFYSDSKCRVKTYTVTTSSADCTCITITSKNSIRSFRVSCAAAAAEAGTTRAKGTASPHVRAKPSSTGGAASGFLSLSGDGTATTTTTAAHKSNLQPTLDSPFPSSCNGTINEHLVLQQGDRYYDTATDTVLVVTDVRFGSRPYAALPAGTQADTCATAARALVLAAAAGGTDSSGASTVVSYGGGAAAGAGKVYLGFAAHSGDADTMLTALGESNVRSVVYHVFNRMAEDRVGSVAVTMEEGVTGEGIGVLTVEMWA